MLEENKVRDQRLRENTPSSKDFYCLLRDTDFTGRCSKLLDMMNHPYFVSVPLGTSRYGEYNIRISSRELLVEKPPLRRPFRQLPPRRTHPPELTPGQMSPLDGIDSGPEDLRYFFQLGKLTTTPTLAQQNEIGRDYIDTGYAVVVNAVDDSLWFVFNPCPEDDIDYHRIKKSAMWGALGDDIRDCPIIKVRGSIRDIANSNAEGLLPTLEFVYLYREKDYKIVIIDVAAFKREREAAQCQNHDIMMTVGGGVVQNKEDKTR
jgi:hypothetical protein